MRLPDIDCRAMMHGASVSSNMDVASLSLLTDRSVRFRQRLALTACAAALCLTHLPVQARGPHNAAPGASGGGFGRLFGGGGLFETAEPHKGRNPGAGRGNDGEERRRRAAAMENRRAEGEGRSSPPPQRKLSPEERKQLRQNIYDVTRDIYHRGGG